MLRPKVAVPSTPVAKPALCRQPFSAPLAPAGMSVKEPESQYSPCERELPAKVREMR